MNRLMDELIDWWKDSWIDWQMKRLVDGWDARWFDWLINEFVNGLTDEMVGG